MEEKERLFGLVSWFRGGYGFISRDDGGKDLFAHWTSIVGQDKFKTLTAGQRVSFIIGQNNKGPQAEDIQVLEDQEEEL